jgi:SAM-dependent methyltransferase
MTNNKEIIQEVATNSKHFFSGDYGKIWVEDEYKHQGPEIGFLMADAVIDFWERFYHNGDSFKLLSPSANVATVEMDMLSRFKERNVKVDFIVGDIAENIKIDSRVSSVSEASYTRLNAIQLPFPDSSFDVLLEKKGFLLQLIEASISEKRNLVSALLEEYFRVIKPGGALLIDSIPDMFAYFTVEDIKEAENSDRLKDMTLDELNKWIKEMQKKKIVKLKEDGLWEEIQKAYKNIGLEGRDNLLQKSPSTLTALNFLLGQDKDLAMEMKSKYEFKQLGRGIHFLTAISKKS